MVGLGDLAGGTFNSGASNVSADGSTVVGVSTSASGTEAFLWTEATGMVALKAYLESDFGLDLAEWTIKSADDISDDGLTIVGSGTNPNGDPEAWIAYVPEPSVALLHGTALLILMGLAARRRS
jgi:probable HAF family extracellular repeat protein